MEEAQQEWKSAVKTVEDYICSLSFEVEENIHQQLFEIQKHLQEYQGALWEYEEAQQAKQEFEDQVDMEKLDQMSREGAGDSVEEIADQMKEVLEEMDASNTAIMEYDKQLEKLREERDLVSEKEEQLEAMREDYAKTKQQYHLIEQTKFFYNIFMN